MIKHSPAELLSQLSFGECQIDWSEKFVNKRSQIQLKNPKNHLFSRYYLVNTFWWHPHAQWPLPASLACSAPGPSGTDDWWTDKM
jgi:hypothetical protein